MPCASFQPATRRLNQLTMDRPQLRAKIASLETDSQLKLKELAQTIDLDDRGKDSAAMTLIKTGQGLDLMNKIRRLTVEIGSEEAAELTAQQALRRENLARTSLFVGALLGTILLFVLFSVGTMLAYIRERERIIADKTLAEAQSAALTKQLWR